MLKNIFQKISRSLSAEALQRTYLLGFIIIIGALAWYQIIQGEYYFRRAKNNYLKVIPLPSIRGTIFDRNRKPLAFDRAIFNIGVIPYQVHSVRDALFKELSASSGLEVNRLHKNYRKNMYSFFSPVDLVTNISKLKALELNEEFTDSLVITTRPQRYYPYSFQLAHCLGYVKQAQVFYPKLKTYGYSPRERVGFSGVEQIYDTYLKGRNGGKLIEVNSQGRVMGFLGQQLPQKGKDIHLTIDHRLQQAAYETLGKRAGVLILMNSNNGEILALCSKPSFDLNDFIEGKNTSRVLNSPKSPLINRAIQAKYPIGSTFKPIVGTASLEEAKSEALTTFNCPGEFKLGLSRFRCWSTHGAENLSEALAHSCNVYFYNLGLKLGPEAISKWAAKFGLNSLSNIDLPFEDSGFVPSVRWKQKNLKSNWFAGDTVNFSIGQGFLTATPLGVLRAMNVFATRGYLVRPRLIKQIGSVESGSAVRNYLGISERSLEAVSQGLRLAVSKEDGTAHLLDSLDLRFSGKTGTAQNPGKSHGWFVGFFTYQDKTYTICLLLEHSRASYIAVKAVYRFIKNITESEFL